MLKLSGIELVTLDLFRYKLLKPVNLGN
ncbi:hypothetical protein A2U01_0107446, partial [Trifolium medium]|nr:hypothetical protein [Trifolium medium]